MKNLKATLLFSTFLFLSISCSNSKTNKEAFIKDLVKQMTLEEKVGQMTQVDKRMLDKNNSIYDQ